MSAQDAQFLESREYSVREVARWFRLPPHMLADLADSSVRANIEQQAIEFIVYSMMPWLTRWQQALNRKLLDSEERQEKYFEFLLDSLLRGDAESRYRAYATGRQWGWFSINDIRRMENLNKIPDGDDYLTPANMQIVGEDPPAPQPSFPAPRRPG
jgi:HK97 family phage portal protein